MPSQPGRAGGAETSTEADSPDPTEILDALGDETCRQILRSADAESTTVAELAAECGVSESTVYRRLSELGELGLVEPTNWPVADECNEYRTTLDTALVSLDDGEFSLSLGDRVDQSTDDDPNDQVDPEDVLRTLESLVEVEHATFDRETRQVELDLTVSDDLFDLLLHRELS
ncbi:ArsR/SmtB family transcription factor [Halospeciosus flavus]|uniref:ArsR/SmtB family transcription factor n=1 Tax=Halospeciosus flavus TaxID=3032283 RepID=A0ABD5YY73_9EURY